MNYYFLFRVVQACPQAYFIIIHIDIFLKRFCRIIRNLSASRNVIALSICQFKEVYELLSILRPCKIVCPYIRAC